MSSIVWRKKSLGEYAGDVNGTERWLIGRIGGDPPWIILRRAEGEEHGFDHSHVLDTLPAAKRHAAEIEEWGTE